jgi:hypothetical protein
MSKKEDVEEEVMDKAIDETNFNDKAKDLLRLLAKEKKPNQNVMDKIKEALGVEVEPPKLVAQSTQEVLAPIIQLKAIDALKHGGGDDDDISKYIKYAILIKLINPSENNQQVAALQQQLQAIQQKLDETEKREFQNVLSETLKSLITELDQRYSKQFEALTQAIEAINSRLSVPNEPSSPASQISSIMEEINSIISGLEKIGIKVIKPSEATPIGDIDSLKKYLSQLGYEIRPTQLTREEVSKIIEEEKKKIEEDLKKQYDDKQAERIKEVILAFLNTVGSKLAEIPLEKERMTLAQEIQTVQAAQNIAQGGAQSAAESSANVQPS